jgi:hypothetical protein
MVAALQGHSKIVEALLCRVEPQQLQSVINSKNLGETPLTLAATQGHIETVKVFLDYGADPNTQTDDGKTALMKAADRNHMGVMQQLVAGADVNLQDAAGATALMWAAHRGYGEAVQLLLSAGADVNLKNRGGYTALMIAEFNGHQNVVRLLQAAAPE